MNNLKSEVRCGFLITSNRKKVWKIELDLCKEFIKICREHDIDWFLFGGAALGAVRHKGFIPWDDDMDIGMTRNNFEKFLSVAGDSISQNMVVQYGLTDDNKNFSHLCRIRDTQSTGIIKYELHRKVGVKGIFIELYVFDKIPNNGFLRRIQRFESLILSKMLDYSVNDPQRLSFSKKIFQTISSIFPPELLFNLWTKCCTFYNNKENYNYYDTITLPHYSKKGIHINKDTVVLSTIEVPFEDITVRISKDYDVMLSNVYGDYMQLPPIERRGTHHNELVYYDPSIDYKSAINSGIPQKYFNGDYGLSKL